jgi:SAM-dependent methyltransferase
MTDHRDPALDRVREEYARRDRPGQLDDRYAPWTAAALLEIQQRQEAVASVIRRLIPVDPARLWLADLGCGTGGPLQQWIALGFSPDRCVGADLLPARLQRARERIPASVGLTAADVRFLPFPDASFDVVSQFTVMSSILEPEVRRAAAREMMRILRPDGLVIWYDFWVNPVNSNTRGIRQREIRELFPGCEFDVQRITLAPPIARRLGRVSTLLCRGLAAMRLFNSHYLIGIRRKGTPAMEHS